MYSRDNRVYFSLPSEAGAPSVPLVETTWTKTITTTTATGTKTEVIQFQTKVPVGQAHIFHVGFPNPPYLTFPAGTSK